MGRKCCVYGCKSGYASKETVEKVSLYRFPKDSEKRRQWVQSLPNKLSVEDITDNMTVCALHFPHGTLFSTGGRHTVPLEPPSVFPNVPPSCYGSTPVSKPRTTLSSTGARNVVKPVDELKEFKQRDTLFVDTFFSIVKDKISIHGYVAHDENTLAFISKQRDGPVPAFSLYLSICDVVDNTINKVKYEAYQNLRLLQHKQLCGAITCWSQFEELIRFILNYDDICDNKHKEKLKFLTRQIELLNVSKNSKVYSMEDFLSAFSFFSKSRSLYEHMRTFLHLPSLSTLRKLTSLAKNVADEILFRCYFKNMEEKSRGCIIIMDEIYVKSSITYKGGVLFGYSLDQPGEIASTLLCIMVKCFFTSEKFLVKLLPCRALTSTFQYDVVKNVILMLESCGADVVAVINDNNRVNQSCFSKFTPISPASPWIVQSPANAERPLFLLYDPVHLLKNIRNNWMTEKSRILEFSIPGREDKVLAKWSDLQELFECDSKYFVKLSNLTKSSISPSNIEKQKVSLVLNIFCDKTSAALKTSSSSTPSWADTAAFLDLVISLWKTMNTKSKFQSQRLRDPDRQVIDRTQDGEKVLEKLNEWAKRAQTMAPGKIRERSLTKDTSGALSWTCHCLADLAKFLIFTEKPYKHEYVLLGFFQQDDLERHFGHFRMSAGSNFYLTVEDVINTHTIDKTKFLLQHYDNNLDFSKSIHTCNLCTMDLTEAEMILLDDLPQEITTTTSDEKLSLFYIAGYISSKHQELASSDHNTPDSQFTQVINRGGLHYPCVELYNLILLAYAFFLRTPEKLCRNRIVKLLSGFPHIFHIDIIIQKSALMRIANIFLKRFALHHAAANEGQDKRKIAKLSSSSHK